jgi:hypothetical protein
VGWHTLTRHLGHSFWPRRRYFSMHSCWPAESNNPHHMPQITENAFKMQSFVRNLWQVKASAENPASYMRDSWCPLEVLKERQNGRVIHHASRRARLHREASVAKRSSRRDIWRATQARQNEKIKACRVRQFKFLLCTMVDRYLGRVAIRLIWALCLAESMEALHKRVGGTAD